MRQRFRWSFGILQAVWKHRAAFTRNKAMGFAALGVAGASVVLGGLAFAHI